MRKFTLFAVLIAVVLNPLPAQCYETDVHFNLTCILCCLGGFKQYEARIIADADQGLDDNDVTSAFPKSSSGKIAHLWNPEPGYLWHSLADGGEIIGGEIINGKLLGYRHKARDGQEAVNHRLDVLWEKASSSDDPNIPGGTDGIVLMGNAKYPVLTERTFRQLVKFGQYLHYYQDSFAHRRPNDYAHLDAGDEPNWEPYGRRFGHFIDEHNPDRIPWRLNLAKAMAAGCYAKISTYSTSVFHRHPIDLSTCVYDSSLTTGPKPIAEVGMKFTDALIDAFAAAYPPIVTPTKNKLSPNLPNPKPYVSEGANEELLLGNVLALMLFTDAKSYLGIENNQPQYEFWDLSHSVAGIGSSLYLMRETIPPINFDAEGDVNMKNIFLHNQNWFEDGPIRIFEMQ